MSCVKKEKMSRGQTNVTCYPRDDSNYTKANGQMSDSFGGSVTNLSHSLSGSANMDGTGHGKKDKFS